MTETPARWKLVEVPSRAAQGNAKLVGNAVLPVVWDATPALTGEPITWSSYNCDGSPGRW